MLIIWKVNVTIPILIQCLIKADCSVLVKWKEIILEDKLNTYVSHLQILLLLLFLKVICRMRRYYFYQMYCQQHIGV
ncbi:Uncharacterised protein [Mycobacteroides abscessus subsp. abscessus]|nr:Uncharacterised protein [Mycobacteroides abscessus subsp. abscessus]